MGFLKKWIRCILSFIAGVLGLAMSACTGMVISGTIDLSAIGAGKESINEATKAYKILTDSSLYTDAKSANLGAEFITMKVFAIITLVVSILLIVYAIIMLLKNLNVIKSDSIIFNIVGWSLACLLLIATIGLLVSSNVFAHAMVEFGVDSMVNDLGLPKSFINMTGKVGLYQPFMLTTSIVLALASAIFAFVKTKKA